jgi:UDP-N-acetylmuramoyl-tripeptide--D-alanyl-D-alanine ligase
VQIDGVSFDSRSLQPGQLFVPLVAERDGHEFIAGAIDRGAAAYLTSRPAGPAKGVAEGVAAIEVPDTLRALMALGSARRQEFHGPVVAITGSVGKTSTKDLAWAALAASRRTWANERSYNNEQGLPTTVLNAPDDTEVMVLEMGMRGHGEIADLCRIARPTIGVLTRVAEAHSDRVGGVDGVARAKGELVESISPNGLAILNHDDLRVRAMAARSAARVLYYGEGRDPAVDVRISQVHLDEIARPTFHLDSPWGSVTVHLGVSGRHMVHNAAAALACTAAAGGDLHEGAAALADVGLTAMRMEVRRTAGGVTVLNDAYNANPTSMRAALDALAALPASRRVAVLGLMAEIADPEREHREIVEYAHGHRIDVIAYGTDLYGITPAADPVAALGSLSGGEAVLVKGSRVVGLERVAAALLLGGAVDAADVAPPREH